MCSGVRIWADDDKNEVEMASAVPRTGERVLLVATSRFISPRTAEKAVRYE